MVLQNADIFTGRLWRSVTHVRHFESACKDPLRSQSKKLLKIVRANESSAFGKAHHFKAIKSIRDFRRAVPPNKYEDLAPYIGALLEGRKISSPCKTLLCLPLPVVPRPSQNSSP